MVVVLKSENACLRSLVSEMVAEDQQLDCDVFPIKIDYDGIKVC